MVSSVKVILTARCLLFQELQAEIGRIKQLSLAMAAQKGISPEKVIQDWEAGIPMRRMGRPEEPANLVVFLVSERASYITGTTTQVDGGYYKGLM